MEGWIKLHRKIQNSIMYRSLNSKQRDVMIQILLMANHVENEWEWGVEIYKCKAGQFITSLESIVKNCAKDVKVQSVRSALLKLEKWGFLTNKSTKTGRLITICKWNDYQLNNEEANKETNKKPTKSQQRANKELTTNKNDKNDKNDKNENEYIPEFSQFKNYALKRKQNIDVEDLKIKYEAWKENGWKDGKNKKIMNWKSKLLQTLPYIKTNQIDKNNNNKFVNDIWHGDNR